MRRTLIVTALCIAATLPAAAQTKSSGAAASAAMSKLYADVAQLIVKSAEQVPADKYSFKPTPAVRSFGELVAHVADAHMAVCSAGYPQMRQYSDATEKTVVAKGKDALIAKLKESIAYCDQGYRQTTEAQLGDLVVLFGDNVTRAHALTLNVAHDWEHYGNIVTYMRLMGMVPPSSQQ